MSSGTRQPGLEARHPKSQRAVEEKHSHSFQKGNWQLSAARKSRSIKLLTTREGQQERLTWVMIYSFEFVQEKVK